MDNSLHNIIKCTKFQMLKTKNDKGELEIEAKVIHSSSHYLRGSYFVDCLNVIGPETQEVRDPTLIMRRWTYKEDSKLILALQILKILGKYNVKKGFEASILIDVEKVALLLRSLHETPTHITMKERHH